jgi:Double zinc ribbon
MRCPRCQHENRPQARFCEQSATPLGPYLPNCNAPASPTARFCSECAQPVARTRERLSSRTTVRVATRSTVASAVFRLRSLKLPVGTHKVSPEEAACA